MSRVMNNFTTGMLDGLWRNNPALVQLLGLCPLLAITTTFINGLALGLATTAVLVATNSIISLIRGALAPGVRILVFVLIIASLVTTVDLLMNAFLHELHYVLGLFIPLIVTNCAILAQAETVASRRPVGEAALAGLGCGLGFAAVLVILGAVREIAGQGTLFSGVDLLLGERAASLRVDLPFDGILIALLPPGAFFGLALLVALKNRLSQHAGRAPAEPTPSPLPEERSR